MAIPPPSGLCSLVASYEGKHQSPVPFPADSWERALAVSRPGVTRLLHDDRYTEPDTSPRSSQGGRRTVTRAAIRSACADIDLEDPDDVLAALVLVMAWGTGTRAASRGIRYTTRTVSDPEAHATLSSAAQILRDAVSAADRSIEKAHKNFSLPGIRQSFFTKWFAFAGYLPGRTWQPLILDDRAYRTLNRTLHVSTTDMAGNRRRAARYMSYVDHLHNWAPLITSEGCAVDAERLEWIFFAHNGKPLPHACEA